ncbi:MAG: hypothetical protein IIC24_09415, partial [Chloroflexi bacterium]|nr:hypothetical protein [Chloroflexota bacterium]
ALDGYTNFPEVTTTKPVVAFDNFESGGFSGGGGWLAAWTVSGDSATQVISLDSPKEGSFHLRLRRDSGLAKRSVDLSGEGQVILQFWARAKSFEGVETATLSISEDGISFTLINTWADGDDDNQYKFYQFDLNTFAPALTSTYVIKFEANMLQNSDHFFVDDLKIIGE